MLESKNTTLKRWYNVELGEDDAVRLKEKLYDLDVKFETSACGLWSVHFEILLSESDWRFDEINRFLNLL